MSTDSRTLLVTPKFRVEEVVRRMPDGGVVRKAVVRHPGAVAVIPLIDRDRICLIRNYRLTVGTQLIEIPAGTLDPGETPERTAYRELIEETGLRANRLSLLCRFYVSPGVLDELMHVFVAEDLTPQPPQPDAGEQIENLIVTWAEALDMIRTGAIQDAKTIAALLLWESRRAAAER